MILIHWLTIMIIAALRVILKCLANIRHGDCAK